MVKLSEKDLGIIAKLISDYTGNQVLQKNYPMIESRMRNYVHSLGLESMNSYWNHFRKFESHETTTLVGLFTTHYTFFFREYVHFEMISNWIEENIEFLKDRYAKTKAPLRVWSAACSKGQEVYSLAMFLSKYLKDKYSISFKILGTDIDQNSVQYAKNGVYPIKEVNTIPSIYLSGNWKKGTGEIKDFAAVHPNLKSHVDFKTLNLLELNTFKPDFNFDIIFCRNVFIYFSAENVKSISFNLNKKLNEGGLLISGLSEPLRYPDWNLKQIGPSTYQLPFSAKEMDSKVASSKPIHKSLPSKRNLRVLCIDDSKVIQSILKKIFISNSQFSHVSQAFNGLEAKSLLDSNQFDLITLDLHMPVMDGISFLSTVYDPKIHPPVIVISSVDRTDSSLATKALELGAKDYVEKPSLNSIDKSTEEILNKSLFVLNNNVQSSKTNELKYDYDINTNLEILNPESCLRIISIEDKNIDKLKFLFKEISKESTSPPLIILTNDHSQLMSLSSLSLVNESKRPIKNLNAFQKLTTNSYYLMNSSLNLINFPEILKFKLVSLFVITEKPNIIIPEKSNFGLQILLDESYAKISNEFNKILNKPISDMTPYTSFQSLSNEFFCSLRKAG